MWKLVQGSVSKSLLAGDKLTIDSSSFMFLRKSENIQYQTNDSDVDDLIINFDVLTYIVQV